MSCIKYIPVWLAALLLVCALMPVSISQSEQPGCFEIKNVSSELYALTPALPIVECLYLTKDDSALEDDLGIVREGCMMPIYRRFIVGQGTDSRIISSAEQFRLMFAPVQSKEEALAFAVALTDSFALYDTTVPEGYFKTASQVTPTYAEDTKEGYAVHLFEIQSCGCGSHPYYAVDYLVTGDGNVTETHREEVFNSNYSICVD